jgi:hypothetical protein
MNAEYVYRWGNNPKRASMKGRRGVIEKVGARQSCMVRFFDTGQREITSRRALARVKGAEA